MFFLEGGNMGFYNIKVYDYLDSVHIRLYSKEIYSSEKVAGVKDLEECLLQKSSDVRTPVDRDRSIRSSRARTIQEIYEITRANTWSYFLTITYNPKYIDRTDYDAITKKTSKWLNNLKQRYAPDLVYILIPELHKDGKSYHFHGLLSHIGDIELKDSGIKQRNGKPIYNLANWKLGFSTVIQVQDTTRVSHYIAKYITKDLCAVTKGKRRYWASRNCRKATVKAYNIDLEEIQNILLDNQEFLSYVKTQYNKEIDLEVVYLEFKKEDIDSFLK